MNQFLLTKKAYSIGLYYHLEKKGKRKNSVKNHSLPARDLQSSTRIYSLVHLLSLSLPVQCNIYVYRFSHYVTSVIAVKLTSFYFLISSGGRLMSCFLDNDHANLLIVMTQCHIQLKQLHLRFIE